MALIIMLTPIMDLTVQATEEKGNVQDALVLVEDGVQVTMSSAAMPAASSKLPTGASGTTRGSGWLTDDPVNVDYRNTLMEARNLTKRTSDDATIVIDESVIYQNFVGVGTSMEHTTVWNLMQLPETKRREVIRYVIDPVNGLGMSMFRLPIGTSDFYPKTEIGLYSYYDIPGNVAPEVPDWYNESGSGFSIDKDRDFGMIEVLQTIMEEAKELGIEDEVHFLATPWSPPGWMKANGQGESGMAGGYLKDEHVDDAAMYYVRYIEEYAKEGLPIYALSLQNQGPYDFFIGINFPNSHMTAEQQAQLATKIKEYLADSEILTTEQKDVKLWALDMSWSEYNSDTYVRTVLDNDKNTSSVDGVAFHDYRSNPIFEGLSTITQEYPDKTVAVSERYLFGTYGMDRIVNYYRNNAISYTSWVTMLNTNGGDIADTRADEVMLMRNPDRDNEVRYLPEAHLIGQFGQIRTGYVRVDSTLGKEEGAEYGISNVVFKNPETGTLTMVVVNNSVDDTAFTVASVDAYQFEAEIPAETVATYVWNPSKIELKTLVDEVDSMNSNEESFTRDSWNVLQGAYADAVAILDNDDASLEKIAAGTEDLRGAIDSLVIDNPGNGEGENDGQPPSIIVKKGEVKEVAASSVVIIEGSNSTVTLPANLPNGTTLNIKDVGQTKLDKTNLIVAGDVLEFNFKYPGSEAFEGDFILSLAYDETKHDADQVNIYYFDEDSQEWVFRGGTTENGMISLEVSHFSTYGVFTEKTEPDTEDDEEVPGSKSGEEPPATNNENNEQTPAPATDNGEEALEGTEVTDSEEKEGERLPDTATTTFTSLMIGLLILLIGVIFAYITRRKKLVE